MTRRLDSLPRTPQTHFRLHLYGAVLQLRRHLPEPGPDNGLAFLSGYYDQFDGLELPDDPAAAVDRWRTLLAEWEAGTSDHLPLRALQRTCGLDALAMELLLATGLPEEDVRFGQVFAAMNGMPGEPRPTAGVLAAWSDDDAARDALGSLMGCGVIDGGDDDVPRSRWPLHVSPAVWEAMRGHFRTPAGALRLRPWRALRPLGELLLDSATAGALARVPDLIEPGQSLALVIRGSEGSGRRAAAGAVAQALGRAVLDVADPWDRAVGPVATLLDALPVYELNAAPGQPVVLPRPAGFAGPFGVLLGRHGSIQGDGARAVVEIGVPSPERREALWVRVLDHHDAARFARRHRLPAGVIAAAAGPTVAAARLAGRSVPSDADVRAALRMLRGDALEALARRVPVTGGWSDLVVAEETAGELALLEARCRNRERMHEYVGPTVAAQLNPGVRILLTGPSGTGKSLAARQLAAVLEKDLYALDLSSVVDKYLGETEKNLEAVLSRAEEHDVVLLLDEGDALLTRRTEVTSSNDRYANLETNYLLQRLETFEGIIAVTTNAADRIDAAFKRRMDAVVEFRAPGPLERRGILDLHLPDHHLVGEGFLDEVATRCELSGGQLRNATLHAALLALREEGPLTAARLDSAVRREYLKAGLVCPLRTTRAAHA